MSSAATTAPEAPGELDLYHLRDSLAQTYHPANAHERMLVTGIAQAWIRLERARELEQRYFEGQDMLAIIRARLAEFKAITRYATDCERAWRHAILALEKSQRQRKRIPTLASPNARRAADRPTPPPPAPTPQLEPPSAAAPAPFRRE
jgi:hypothetical protein